MQGFDQQWYAVALSEEIRSRKKHGIRVFGQDIVLWRLAGGALRAVHGRCPHMGASLSIGRVIDDQIECPYHGFRYDETGQCTHTPLRRPDAMIPRTLCVRRYAVAERDGWVFLYWGDADDELPELQYFDEAESPLLHAWTAKNWPVHFTRFIENTVDVAHLGTVHRGTLSWSIPDVVELTTRINGKRIDVVPPSTTDLPVVSSILYPNMALLYLHEKFLTVFVGVPVDDRTTRLYVRSSQGFVRWPLIGRVVTVIKHWADMAALWQDEGAMLTVEPKNTDEARREVLLEFDEHIGEYRKMRRRLAPAGRPGDRSAAPAVLRSGLSHDKENP